MKVVSKEQMMSIEKIAIEDFKIPSIILMENAAVHLFNRCMKKIKDVVDPKVAIVVGTGNNGGDGLALARHLYTSGIDVHIILIGKTEDVKSDALINLEILRNIKVKITIASKTNIETEIVKIFRSSDIIVDAIFGIGLNKNIDGLFFDVINSINHNHKYVISVDIPSGINSNTGEVMGICVLADETVTFEYIKKGLILYPGNEYCGEIFKKKITIPTELIDNDLLDTEVYFKNEIKNILPKRGQRTNKGSFGKAFVFAGNSEMTGAAYLCSKAAYRSGCGLVYGYFIKPVVDVLQKDLIEVVYKILNDKNGKYTLDGFEDYEKDLLLASTIIIGSGIGQGTEVEKFVFNILEKANSPLVIDADALNCISTNPKVLKNIKNLSVITPHPLEMSRLTGLSVEEILKNPIDTAKNFSKKYNVVTLLKDNRTIVTSPSGDVYINTTGNNSMAKGGSGDVLAGVIGSFIAQGLNPFEATKLGAFIHGESGEMASEELSLYGVLATDILDYIPYVLNKYK